MEKVIARSLLLWGAIGLASPVAQAAEPPTAAAKAIAKKAYEQGTTHYKKGEWDLAIEQFELCHKSLPQPVFLFNIAQSHNKGRANRPGADVLQTLPERCTDGGQPRRGGRDCRGAGKAGSTQSADCHDGNLPSGSRVRATAQRSCGQVRAAADLQKTWLIIAGAAGGAIVLGTVIGLSVYFGTKGPTTTVFNPVNP